MTPAGRPDDKGLLLAGTGKDGGNVPAAKTPDARAELHALQDQRTREGVCQQGMKRTGPVLAGRRTARRGRAGREACSVTVVREGEGALRRRDEKGRRDRRGSRSRTLSPGEVPRRPGDEGCEEMEGDGGDQGIRGIGGEEIEAPGHPTLHKRDLSVCPFSENRACSQAERILIDDGAPPSFFEEIPGAGGPIDPATDDESGLMQGPSPRSPSTEQS